MPNVILEKEAQEKAIREYTLKMIEETEKAQKDQKGGLNAPSVLDGFRPEHLRPKTKETKAKDDDEKGDSEKADTDH